MIESLEALGDDQSPTAETPPLGEGLSAFSVALQNMLDQWNQIREAMVDLNIAVDLLARGPSDDQISHAQHNLREIESFLRNISLKSD